MEFYTVAIISAIGVTGALIFNGLKLQKDQNLRFSEMLERFDHDLRKFQSMETGLKTYEDMEPYSNAFLNILDRLAYLKKLKKIDDNMINYFDWYFRYGLRLIEWKNEILNNKNACEIWSCQIEWTKERGLSIIEESFLPPAMLVLLKEKRTTN